MGAASTEESPKATTLRKALLSNTYVPVKNIVIVENIAIQKYVFISPNLNQ